MAKLGFFRGLLSAITSKTQSDGSMYFTTDTNELLFDYSDNGTVTRSAVKDKGAARSFNYSNYVLSLKDGANNTLSSATIVPDPTDYVALSISNDGHLIYTKSDQLEGVDFSISNHSDLILTIDDD